MSIEEDRMERAQARLVVESMTDDLNELRVQHVWCGSLRRGAATVGDLDLVVVEVDADDPRLSVLGEKVSGGPMRSHYQHESGRKVDVWSCTREQTGPMVLFATGPGRLNIVMRTKAERVGLLLNQYGLWEGERRVDDNTERDVFEKVGMTWRTPRERERDFR